MRGGGELLGLYLFPSVIISDAFFIKGTVIGITQPPPRDGAWSALFSNLSKFALANYVVKLSERPLLEEAA